VQYDDFVKGTSFIHDPCTLTRFDPAGVRIGLSLRHRGVEALERSLETALSDIEARTKDIERLQEHVQLRSAENLALQQALEQREAEISDARLQLADSLSELARVRK
jgi:chromosome segregation ATPase